MKKIIIFGGSGGIGSAAARLLHSRGYSLHLTGRNGVKLQEVAEETQAGYTAGDITDAKFIAHAAEEAGDQLAGLIYAVGTISLGSIQRLSETDYLNDFRVNAVGAALAIRSVLPALKKNEDTASIVLFSSIAAHQGFKMHASMGMAKGAVSGLTLSLAAELAPKIRVNAIAPSLTQTELAGNIVANEQSAVAIAGLHPIPRLGNPEDIASLAAFLVSEEANWITGQIIGVDGGRSTVRTKG